MSAQAKQPNTSVRPSAVGLRARPPVVVVMGHIDHGKSTLLDYIRKTNVVDKEAGGITQRISAYEVIHKDDKGVNRKITFLDTPGHEAFSKMRERGAKVADIAILVVSAEDGVKPQTVEAWKTIVEAKLPCVVAINKIDKPEANIEKTKMDLAEKEIYLEGYGGKVPFALISAKVGTGVDELLSLILILAELENFETDLTVPAAGSVIEAHLDPRRGIVATLVVKGGTLKKGMTVAAEDSICSTRMMEDFLGKPVDKAGPSAPILLTGWSKLPPIGAQFKSFDKKNEAEEYARNFQKNQLQSKEATTLPENAERKIIPVVLKTDVAGSLEAIEKELGKLRHETAEFKVVVRGTGAISESDIKGAAQDTIILGFNVKADRPATDLAMKRGIEIHFFDVIYKMTEWLAEELEKRRPKVETTETTGKAKILKTFIRTKERQILGGKVYEGEIANGAEVKILRRDFEIGKGKIVNLEKAKAKVSSVSDGSEFGMMIESKIEIVSGDVIESFTTTHK